MKDEFTVIYDNHREFKDGTTAGGNPVVAYRHTTMNDLSYTERRDAGFMLQEASVPNDSPITVVRFRKKTP